MTKPLRTLLIDDEKHCLESLEIELGEYCPQVEIVRSCLGSQEGLTAILEQDPDLVFLDIDMPGMNGFELLQNVDRRTFDVIFATAYDEYAMKAIKVSAMDYLLKPIDHNDLQAAVRRVEQKRDSEQANAKIDVLLTNLASSVNGFKKIAIPTSSGLDLIDTQDIIMCEADGSYTTVYTVDNKSYLVSKTLKEISELLESPLFFRTHQSYLVNLNHASSYVKGSGGHLVMTNKRTAQVARARKDDLMSLILRRN